ncbi:hypothetical protein [Carboxylicivirga sp. N1Y90]|uniref:hypothetical protein n=1 Tax=Carboxylicivirga fragile TaxID=3417571 RepID=UPI003D353FF7|nr:hypothetical protein [Marinilabiliaceae bacterium N1Y90]
MDLKYYTTEFDSQLLLIGKHQELSKNFNAFFTSKGLDMDRALKFEVFVDVQLDDDLVSANENLGITLAHISKKGCPSYAISALKPLDNDKEAKLIITYCNDAYYKIEYKDFQKKPYTLVSDKSEKYLFSGGISSINGRDTLGNIQLAFDFTEQLLDHEEMHFGHLININYLLEDKGVKKDFEGHTWTYAEMVQQVSQLYFDPTLFKGAYPTSSLMSNALNGVNLQFIAGSKDSFSINQKVDSSANIEEVSASQLSYVNEMNTLFISGISSSMLSKGKKGNIIQQTEACINEIKNCIAGSGFADDADSTFDVIKVYLSKNSNFEDVKLMLEQQIKATNYLYLLADLPNKDDLLMIEGVVAAK